MGFGPQKDRLLRLLRIHRILADLVNSLKLSFLRNNFLSLVSEFLFLFFFFLLLLLFLFSFSIHKETKPTNQQKIWKIVLIEDIWWSSQQPRYHSSESASNLGKRKGKEEGRGKRKFKDLLIIAFLSFFFLSFFSFFYISHDEMWRWTSTQPNWILDPDYWGKKHRKTPSQSRRQTLFFFLFVWLCSFMFIFLI